MSDYPQAPVRQVAELAVEAAFKRYHRAARWYDRLERLLWIVVGFGLGGLVAWVRYSCGA